MSHVSCMRAGLLLGLARSVRGARYQESYSWGLPSSLNSHEAEEYHRDSLSFSSLTAHIIETAAWNGMILYLLGSHCRDRLSSTSHISGADSRKHP